MNMSYCRFQNTESDLGDCLDAIIEDKLKSDSSLSELNSANAIYELALEYVREYENWTSRREDEEYEDEE